jgi:hypothetical protein
MTQSNLSSTLGSTRKKNPKNDSWACFTSSSAVQSRSSQELNKLYFRSTAGDFQKWLTEKDDSFTEIYDMGHKSTKHLPFQYRQAKGHGVESYSYTQDFKPKESDAHLNNELAISFSRPHCGWTGSASICPGVYATDFVKHPRRLKKTDGKIPTKPELLRTQVLSCSDSNHETSSKTHQSYASPPKRDRTKPLYPNSNLVVTGMDPGDCYKGTYGETFKGMNRCSTAPANMSRQDKREGQQEAAQACNRPNTSSGSRPKVMRNIFTRPGG